MPQLGPHSVTLDNWVQLAPFETLLGMEILSAKEGSAVLTMPFSFELAQGAGLMHGGALMSLADTALAMAVKTCLPENTRFGTIAFESRFLKAVTQGIVTAQAKVTLTAERTYTGEVEVQNQAGEIVFTANATFKVARATALV